jgi:hypothetical protein
VGVCTEVIVKPFESRSIVPEDGVSNTSVAVPVS